MGMCEVYSLIPYYPPVRFRSRAGFRSWLSVVMDLVDVQASHTRKVNMEDSCVIWGKGLL